MRTIQELPATCAALAIVGVLAGCESPGPVLDPLPPPYYHTRQVAPPKPEPPKPPVRAAKSIREATIVIDAGHGGRDPGAWPRRTSRLPEKTIVLDIANRLARQLADLGAKVITTRTTDVFVELDQRAATAERSRADLFVSIHADYARRTSASGTGVHIHTHASVQSHRAAMSLVAAFKRAGIGCRGIYRNNFHVLREHSRPAVLVECGFLTNAADARKLNTPAYRSTMAAAITDGIAGCFAR